MKNLKIVGALFLFFLFTLEISVSAADEVSVTINDVPMVFADQLPVNRGGRLLVPMRGVFESLGFTVTWDGNSQKATLTRGDDVVEISIGSERFFTNGEQRMLDVPAQIINGRTMLPIRAVLESVGYDVGWDERTNTVLISSHETPRITSPVEKIPTDNPQTFEDQISKFSQEFFRRTLLSPQVNDENMVISPLSAYYALAMVALGAGGETYDEFSRLLNGEPKILARELAQYAESLMDTRGSTNLTVAGSVWLRDTFTVHPEFNRKMTDYFDAPAFPRNFNASETVVEINEWVSEKTNGLIPEIIDEISNDHVMFLLNTLYMYAKWADAFRPMNESVRAFTPEKGTAKSIDFSLPADNREQHLMCALPTHTKRFYCPMTTSV
jgi:hypothetical protein